MFLFNQDNCILSRPECLQFQHPLLDLPQPTPYSSSSPHVQLAILTHRHPRGHRLLRLQRAIMASRKAEHSGSKISELNEYHQYLFVKCRKY